MIKGILRKKIFPLVLLGFFILGFSSFPHTTYAYSINSILAVSFSNPFTNYSTKVLTPATNEIVNIFTPYIKQVVKPATNEIANIFTPYTQNILVPASKEVKEILKGYENNLAKLITNPQTASVVDTTTELLTQKTEALPPSKVAQATSSVPSQTYPLASSSPTTATPIIIKQNNTTISEAKLLSLLQQLLNKPEILAQLKGEKGDIGESGKDALTTNVQSPSTFNFGTTIPNPAPYIPNASQYNGSPIGILGGFSSLGAQEITTNTINVTNLSTFNNITVTGGTTLQGNLTVSGTITGAIAGTINPSFTLGSIPFQGVSGLAEDTDLTFSTDTLSATKLLSSTSISTPSFISTGAITITPNSGNHLNFNLSGAGDFKVNTNQFYIDTSTGFVGIGSNTPDRSLEIYNASAPQLRLSVSDNDLDYTDFQTNSSANLVISPTGGSVGINVTPSALLHLKSASSIGSITTVLRLGAGFSSTAGGQAISFYGTNDTNILAQIVQSIDLFDATAGVLRFYTTPGSGSTTERMRINSTGLVGIGTDTPTAVLHLKAGTAAVSTAPLKFTSGTLLTTPEAGAVEFLTDAYYGTITTGTSRKTFAFLESPVFTGTVTIPTPFALGAVSVLPTGTELNYVDGVTSNIQTQLDSKASTTAYTLAGVSLLSNDTTKSLYTMTSAVPVEFRRSGGSTLMYLDETNGRVGIGTNTPTRPLTIKADDLNRIMELRSFSDDTKILTIRNNGTSAAIVSTNLTGGFSLGDTTLGELIINQSPDNDNFMSLLDGISEELLIGRSDDTGNFNLTGGHITVTSSGRVGIGTSSPTGDLDISKAGGASLYLHDPDNGSLSTDGFALYMSGNTAYVMNKEAGSLIFRTSDTDRMTINSSGNVGIGTSTLTYRLNVKSATGQNSYVFADTTDSGSGSEKSGFVMGRGGTYKWYFENQGNALSDKLYLLNGSDSAVMSFLQTGEVGIGTTSPSKLLHLSVANNPTSIQLSRTGTSATEWYIHSGATGTSSTAFSIGDPSLHRFVIQATTGVVGIGATTPTTARLVLADTTLAGSGSLAGGVLDMTQTWNTTGTPTAIKLNVTDTASNSSSLLMALQKNGSNMFTFDKNGTLTVSASGNATILGSDNLYPNSNTRYLYLSGGSSGSTGVVLYGASHATLPDVMTFLTASTERMRIASNGYVGIGTTPSTIFQVKLTSGQLSGYQQLSSDFNSGTSTGSMLGISFGATSGNTYTELRALAAGGNAWNNLILQSGGGNVGIGNTSPIAAKLVITGSGTTSSTSTLLLEDSAGADIVNVKDDGTISVGKNLTLGSAILYQTLSIAQTVTNNTSNGNVVGGFNTEFTYAGTGSLSDARVFNMTGLNTNTSTSNVIRGIYASARNSTAGSRANTLVGIGGFALSESTGGTITTFTGIDSTLYANGVGGTITNAYGLRVSDITNSGTITNTYGVHVGDITTGTQTNTPFSFYASDANAYNYFAGFTGIGITPLVPLHVQYSNNGNNAAYIYNTHATGYGMLLRGGHSGGSTYALAVQNVDGTDLMRLTGAGNLGIGTTGPDRKLDILDTTNPQLRLTHTDSTWYTDFQTNSSGNLIISPIGNRVVLSNSSGSGDLYLSATTPSTNQFIFTSNITTDSGTNPAVLFSAANSIGGYIGTRPLYLFGDVASNPFILVHYDGRIGINNSTPTARLDVKDTTLAGSGSLAASALNIAQTWNTTGTPTAIKLNVTDTASNSASLLMDLQKGGTSQFKVSKGGDSTIGNDLILGSSGGAFIMTGSGKFRGSGSEGVMRMTNTAGDDFSRLQFGGTTSSFPSLKRSTTGLIVRLADDSANAPLTASIATFSDLGTGTVYSNSGLLTNVDPSDINLKNTINPLTYGLNEIMQLEPKTFYYNDDLNKNRLKYGFLAQDVQLIMPDLVHPISKDSRYLGIETSGIYVTLVNAVKELNTKIEDIKTPIKAWFSDATNGIEEFFANRVHTKELCVRDNSGAETCLTKAQLDALILNSGRNTNNNQSNGGAIAPEFSTSEEARLDDEVGQSTPTSEEAIPQEGDSNTIEIIEVLPNEEIPEVIGEVAPISEPELVGEVTE